MLRALKATVSLIGLMRRISRGGPYCRQHLCSFEHGLSGLILLAGGSRASGGCASLVLTACHRFFPNHLVDRNVVARCLNELPRDALEIVLAEDLDGAVVRLQRIVKGHLFLGQA